MMKCDDPAFLKELGVCYKKLLFVGNKSGHNPHPCMDIFPTKYFILLYNKKVSIGIPDNLEERIRKLLDSVDVEDFVESIDRPLPIEKKSSFTWGMMQG